MDCEKYQIAVNAVLHERYVWKMARFRELKSRSLEIFAKCKLFKLCLLFTGLAS